MIEHGDETDTPEELVTTIKGDLSSDEVYVFTPRGDVKALPKGATVIDLLMQFIPPSVIKWSALR